MNYSAGGTAILAISLPVVVLSCCLACLSQIAQGRDTVTITDPLRYGDVLVSPGDMYELGFFRPATSNNNTYLGMWYKHAPGKTVVWVANREVPVTDSSGSLTIDQQGNAIIVDGRGVQVWSTNLTRSARPPLLQLLRTGNLVLREEGEDQLGEEQSSSSSYILWQSFDYPTDSMLAGMKLGWDLRIGLERKLTCWRSSTDPSPGEYTFTIVPQGLPSIFMMHRSVPTYRSGAWNGVRFSGVPEMRSNYVFNFQFVSNYPAEVYYAYTLQNASMMSRLMVNSEGQLERLTWVEQSRNWSTFWSAPKDRCDNFMECGPYGICNTDDFPVCQCPAGFKPRSAEAWYLRDGSDGCVRSVELQCGESDGFLRLEGVKLPESRAALVDMGMSIDECEVACRSNCSCIGYAPADVSGRGRSGCVRWHDPLLDIRAYRSGTVDEQLLFVRVPASVLGASLLFLLFICVLPPPLFSILSFHVSKKNQTQYLFLISLILINATAMDISHPLFFFL